MDGGGGKGRKRCAFHVTGFGRFRGVPENPTTRIVELLPARLALRPLLGGARVASWTVLETSAEAARAEVDRIVREGRAEAEQRGERAVFVHLGVAGSAEGFRLERTAFNEATFRVPDERGAQPQREPVDPGSGGVERTLLTALPVERAAEALAARGHGVRVSDDAGRFVCNFTLFVSLLRSGGDSVFVHVPPLERVPLERQLDFVRDALEEFAASPPSESQP